MIFDWYQAGIEAKPEVVVDHLCGSFDLADVQPAIPKNGYATAVKVVRGEHCLAEVSWGGNTGKRVLVKGSGSDSPAVASILRAKWPRHQVVRADVCEDYNEPQAFDALSSMLINVADQHRLKVTHYGDWHRGEDGRTLYVGSRQSCVYLRLYEKGHQMRSKGLDSASLDWVRLEVEVKAKQQVARYHLSQLEPDEFMGCSEWTTQIAGMLLESSLRRVTGLGTVRQPTDRDRALSALVKQYGRHLEGVRNDAGSWEAVGRLLGEMIRNRH